ncbi:patatin-like phospholipase family protein [Arthrobacter sp. zg-Y820]|uniref:patatin-like phospholipase family protein n=1 Tax=unclassified Arthrobacter TaxID=235627 RepID=UPI001E386F75|nr:MULTISPECIES: patatin-like phospholipase family protein [unclassified Arthrobacter]MCC9198558.1 patatin-like phospholipase family protein [Arthrobacter sp. zg-Y820]MDK1281428.1 patatin-like phospholipase family protein [Arthrobacter sp. zg.Y820]WIB09870.1 patatin-like phospholipase family protein [Arthrobacter sp. zg-Y820]
MLRILSIDGGGVRGIIPIIWLMHLERRTGRRTADLFDLIVGTSVGGMIALALTCPRDDGEPYSARDLRHLNFESAKGIFPRNFSKPSLADFPRGSSLYSAQPLQQFLAEVLGNAKLSEATRPVAVTTCDLAHTQALHFSGGGLDQSQLGDAPMALAARATGSLPRFFPPVTYIDPAGQARELVDGGLAADDPALVAHTLGLSLPQDDDGVLLVSLGTGTSGASVGLLLNAEQTQDTPDLQALELDFAMVFGGPGQLMRDNLRQLLGTNYVRVQARLLPGTHHASNDAGVRNLLGLVASAEKMALDSSAELGRLAGLLQGG